MHLAETDRFDPVHFDEVVRVCHESRTQSDARRRLVGVTRPERKHADDADRLVKYFARFGLSWPAVTHHRSGANWGV